MTAPSPSSRALGTWFVWFGGGCSVILTAFLVAWWKLPQWAPEFVIEHSPWLDPGVRALLELDHFDRVDEYQKYTQKWGAKITTYLVERFPHADQSEGGRILEIAAEVSVLIRGNDPDHAHLDRLTPEDRERGRSKLHALIKQSLSRRVSHFTHQALSIAVNLKAYDLSFDFAQNLKYSYNPLPILSFISASRDLRCLSYVVELIDDKNTEVRVAAITTIGLAGFKEAASRLAELITSSEKFTVRNSAVDALGRLAVREHAPLLRNLVDNPTDSLRGAAIIALGEMADPADFQRLFQLLSVEEDHIGRKARIALLRLPLTPEQQHAVEAAWEAANENNLSAEDASAINPP
jgi:hypothetical protein